MHLSPPVFCSISDTKELLFSYNGGNGELEALAYVLLKKAPLHHVWSSQTTQENRTVGFLMEDGYTYFAILQDKGNLESLMFLKSLRDGFMKAPCKTTTDALQAELDPLVHSLIHGSNGGGDPNKSGRGGSVMVMRPAKAVEVALISPRDRKKGKDRGTDQAGDQNSDRGLKIDIAQEHNAAPITRRGTSSKLRAPQQTALAWRRHVKVVAAIDAVLCLGLLTAWLVVCRGLQCVAGAR